MLPAPSEDIRCGECGQPLSSWAEPHDIDDCRWWQQTQLVRDALVRINRMQAELLNHLTGDSHA